MAREIDRMMPVRNPRDRGRYDLVPDRLPAGRSQASEAWRIEGGIARRASCVATMITGRIRSDIVIAPAIRVSPNGSGMLTGNRDPFDRLSRDAGDQPF